MQFHRRCVVLALLWKLLSCARDLHKNKFKKNFRVVGCVQCLWILSLIFAVLQMCVCVWSMDAHCTKLTFGLHHARHSCSVFTALWCDCSVVKLIFYLHQTPSWLRLVWTNKLTCWHNSTNDDYILCMRYQSPSPAHPSAADEAWYWLKHVLHNGPSTYY